MVAASMSLPAFEGYLHRGLQEATTNPLALPFVRRLAGEEPELFETVAVSNLTSGQDPQYHRLLSSLLRRQIGILDHLTDPRRWSRETAITLVRGLLTIDPSFDITLARSLPARDGSNWRYAVKGMAGARTLDILNVTSRGRRLIPILGHLVDFADRHVAEGATLFIGKRLQSPSWVSKALYHDEPRVRANAVESIWGVRSTSAIDLFKASMKDSSSRVVGNAVLGLALAGGSGMNESVIGMSRRKEIRFRATAGWVIGRILDPAHLPVLEQLCADESPEVRSSAERARSALSRMLAEAVTVADEDTVPFPPVVLPDTPSEPDWTDALPLIDLRLDGSHFRAGDKPERSSFSRIFQRN
jgi:hypothetical protein